mgnify:CR=1 FL=1
MIQDGTHAQRTPATHGELYSQGQRYTESYSCNSKIISIATPPAADFAMSYIQLSNASSRSKDR